MKAKKISIITMLLIAAILVGAATPIVLAAENPEVVVTVYVNAHDEDYIKNIQFDDGTTVGDYNYVIEYAAKARDTSELTTYFDYVGWIQITKKIVATRCIIRNCTRCSARYTTRFIFRLNFRENS